MVKESKKAWENVLSETARNKKGSEKMTRILVWKRKEEPFRVSNAVSTKKIKKRKVTRWSGGVKIEH
jgi:hypothetical protein